jgi:hypothetical protein
MVISPCEQELSELDRFREEFRIALRGPTPAPDS